MLDEDCWKLYPNQRLLFNKLWIAEMLGHHCGPCGVTVDKDGLYMVRPIYNLDGMSRGAQSKYLHTCHFMAWKQGLKTLYYCRSEKIGKADKVSKRIERQVIEELDMKAIAEGETCLACEG